MRYLKLLAKEKIMQARYIKSPLQINTNYLKKLRLISITAKFAKQQKEK